MEEQNPNELENDLYLYPEGRSTLKIFPLEIWETILEHVENSKDLQNFGKAFPFWEEILYRTKQAWLFDQVFQQIWTYLSKPEILSCRQICKRWLSSVDNFLENHEYNRPSTSTLNTTTIHVRSHLRLRPLIRGLRSKGLLYSCYSQLRMQKLTTAASTHPRNPIIGRSVYIDWRVLTRLPSSSTPFFSKFGKHIWCLRVECTQPEVNPIPFLVRILQNIPHLPNLRKLEMYLCESQEGQAHLNQTALQSTKEFERFLKDYPIGAYPNLETLELEIMGHLHGNVKEVLMNSFSSQVRRLAINRFALCNLLPNLTELMITVDSNYQIECLLNLDSPISRLAISIVDNANYPLTFKAINKFSLTVLSLAIEFPTATSFSPLDWKQLKFPVFNLPRLKTLAIKGCVPPSLNFICGLKSVEYLHIYDQRSSELVALLDNQTVFEEEIVQILRYLNQPSQFEISGCMYKSNLWEIFPKIREFTFTSFMRREPDVERCYRRDYYDKIKFKENLSK